MASDRQPRRRHFRLGAHSAHDRGSRGRRSEGTRLQDHAAAARSRGAVHRGRVRRHVALVARPGREAAGRGGRRRLSSPGAAGAGGLTPSLVVLLVANALPIAGVLFLGWGVFPLVLLYWLENVVVGGFNVAKLLLAQPRELVVALLGPKGAGTQPFDILGTVP